MCDMRAKSSKKINCFSHKKLEWGLETWGVSSVSTSVEKTQFSICSVSIQ